MKRLDQKRSNSIGNVRQSSSKYKTHQVQNQGGSGIFSNVTTIGSIVSDKLLNKRPKILNDLFKTDGNINIVKLEVCRVPIFSVFRKILNFLSAGKLNREMKKFAYDDLFHLYCIIHLENGKVYSIEKNQRVKIINGAKKGKKSECLETQFSGKTLEQFLIAPEKDHLDQLYQYNAFKYNCQDYIKKVFNANGISQFDDFIIQKVDTLVPSILKKISKSITNFAGLADYLYRGGGMV